MKNALSVLAVDLHTEATGAAYQLIDGLDFRIQVKHVNSTDTLRAALDEKTWDLVVTGHKPLDSNGKAMIALSRQHLPDVPVVFMGDAGNDVHINSVLEAGNQVFGDNFSRLISVIARAIEAQNLEKEDRYRQLLNSGLSIFYTTRVDKDFRCNFVTDNLFEIMGYKPEDMLSDPEFWINHIHPKDAARIYDEFSIELEIGGGALEYRFLHADEHYRWVDDRFKVIYDENNAPIEIFGSWTDISQAHELSEELSYKASHDALTGLYNRQEFERRITRLLTDNTGDNNEHALCYLDLDQFKIINHTCGHEAGDKLLSQVGKLIKDTVRKRDTVARLGVDEFAVLLEQCSVAYTERLANTLLKAVDDMKFKWQGEDYTITSSIALVPVNEFMGNSTRILGHATAVCQMAKNQGGNRISVFNEKDDELEQFNKLIRWVPQINRALQQDRFRLYFQPIQPIGSGKGKCEILVRMVAEDGKLVPPNSFLPAVEHYNLSNKMDKWVIHHTLLWLAENRDVLDTVSTFGINLSGKTMADREFIGHLKEEIARFDIPPECLCFEITETAAIRNFEDAFDFVNELTQLGCQFALDDFGSGLSSFAYLRKFPVDVLKIDGMFIKNIAEDSINFAIARSINEIGKVMHITTVAEYVENDLILNILKDIGVDYAQGYGISKPRPIEDLMNYALTA